MIGPAVLAVVQAAALVVSPDTVTVGDSVYVLRHIRAAPEVQPRLEVLEPTPMVVPLRAPVARHTEGTLSIVYTVAVFMPGRHAVVLPAVDLLYPDGRVETVLSDTAWVFVASVLPVGDTLPDPMPSLGPLARQPRRLIPLLFFLFVVAASVVVWSVARRRVGSRPPPVVGQEDHGAAPPVEEWIGAGEPRAVAALTAERLRAHIAALLPEAARHLDTAACLAVVEQEAPHWPLGQLGEILHGLERARFAPAVSSDVITLVDEADQLLGALRRASVEEAVE